MALVADLGPPQVRKVMKRLDLPSKMAARVQADLMHFRRLAKKLALREDRSPSGLFRLMARSSTEALLLLMALCKEERTKKIVSDYLTIYSRTATHLRGKDLKALGVKAGPIYRKMLNTLLYARIDRKVETREEEMRLIQRKFKTHLLPPPASISRPA
jgi:tRNA nucleotidyltransferase (CCA-adding enzyme)